VTTKPTDIKPPSDEKKANLRLRQLKMLGILAILSLYLKHILKIQSGAVVEFVAGRNAIVESLKRKWSKQIDYRLMKELWCYTANRISVRFEYECRVANNSTQWMRTHGNEHWEFNNNGFMQIPYIRTNDYPIKENQNVVAINNIRLQKITKLLTVIFT
jgi:hypothetical protein